LPKCREKKFIKGVILPEADPEREDLIARIAKHLYKAKSALILDHALSGSKSVAKALAELHKISAELKRSGDR
jgi:hypothetical protein